MAKRKKSIYTQVLKLNSENCQNHNLGFSDVYFERLVYHIINEARK